MASNERRSQQRAASVAKFDFRRPGAFSREAVRSLAALHELFGRRVATGWGSALRAMVQVEEISIDQATYGDFLASMPNPNALSTISLAPLPGHVVAEMGVEFALVLVDRLLGSSGSRAGAPPDPRRLTDVETALLRHLLAQVVAGLDDALGGLLPVAGELESVEYNPQLVQVTAPSDRVVLLTYRVAMTQGLSTEGLLTLCYPAQTLTPIVDRILKQMYSGGDQQPGDGTANVPIWSALLQNVEVDLAARLRETQVPARDLASLAVGDVLRLDHRVEHPVRLSVDGRDLVEAHAGRRGRRLAVQLGSDLPPDAHAALQPDGTDLADADAEADAGVGAGVGAVGRDQVAAAYGTSTASPA